MQSVNTNNQDLVSLNNWYIHVGKNNELAFIFRGLYNNNREECFQFEFVSPSYAWVGGQIRRVYQGNGIWFPNSTVASNFFQYLVACREVKPGGKYNTCSKDKFFTLFNVYDETDQVVGFERIKFDTVVKKDTFKTKGLNFKDLYCPPAFEGDYSIFNINGVLVDRTTPAIKIRMINGYKDFLRPHELISMGLIPSKNTEEELRRSGVTMPFDEGYSARVPLSPAVQQVNYVTVVDPHTREIKIIQKPCNRPAIA